MWTFNLGFGMRSVTGGVHFQPNFLIFLFLTIYLHLSLVTSFQFNCDPIQQCFCHEGIGFDEWEIQCPKGLHEIFDISLKGNANNVTAWNILFNYNVKHNLEAH